MKFWKYSLMTVFAFLSIASTVLYSSCQRDSCLELRCRNGGTCADGFCRCMTGYEGPECEKRAVLRFVGFYDGITQYQGVPSFADSGVVFVKEEPNMIGMMKFSNPADTIYGTIDGDDILLDQPGGRYIRITKTTPTQVELYINERINDSTIVSTFRGNLRPGTAL